MHPKLQLEDFCWVEGEEGGRVKRGRAGGGEEGEQEEVKRGREGWQEEVKRGRTGERGEG